MRNAVNQRKSPTQKRAPSEARPYPPHSPSAAQLRETFEAVEKVLHDLPLPGQGRILPVPHACRRDGGALPSRRAAKVQDCPNSGWFAEEGSTRRYAVDVFVKHVMLGR